MRKQVVVLERLDHRCDAIVAANWDSMVFDVGTDPLRRVPMMEPGRGSKAHVGTLLAEARTAAELLDWDAEKYRQQLAR